jgi:hypothetical protein
MNIYCSIIKLLNIYIMKLQFFLFALLLTIFTACENAPGVTTTENTDDTAEKKGKNSSTSINFNALASVPKPGNWIVTLYQEDATVKTTKFSGYTFTFNASNKITAVKGGIATDGKWGTANDSSKKKLYINFATGKPLSELTEDWVILEETTSKLRLQHVSGGNGGTDILTLETN